MGITVMAGGRKDTRDIAVRAQQAAFDGGWSGEFLNRSGVVSVAEDRVRDPAAALEAEVNQCTEGSVRASRPRMAVDWGVTR